MSTTAKLKSVTLAESFNSLYDLKYQHLIAGICGGVLSTVVLHPLDVIKIRFAVSDGRTLATPRYTGIWDAFATILRKEGAPGLYRGLIPNVLGAGSSWGLYFFFYNAIKTRTQQQGADNKSTPLGPVRHLTAASEAGALTLLFTNPLWVTKTRLCLQFDINDRQYRGFTDALRKIYATEGIRGLYRGFLPGLLGVSHGAVQFMVYEELKSSYCQFKGTPITSKLDSMEYVTFAALSKIVAASITYPYQVVRARLQDQHRFYRGVRDCVKQTWTYEGWRGFYKGLGANLLRVTPATMITFVTYENITHLLLPDRDEKL